MAKLINPKSKKELNENELQKVNGGFEFVINSLDIGDCFSYRTNGTYATFLMCRKNYPEVNDDTSIEFDMYYDVINDNGYHGTYSCTAKNLENGIYGYDYFHSNKNYIPR